MAFSCWFVPNNTITYKNLAEEYFKLSSGNFTTRLNAILQLVGNDSYKYLPVLQTEEDLNIFERMLLQKARESTVLESVSGVNHTYYYTSCEITRVLWLYLPPILLILGTIGNALSFLVMCQKSMLNTSTYVYLAALAIVDEIVLLFGLLPAWLEKITGYDLVSSSDGACKVIQMIGITFNFTSVWLIVTVTVERLLVIRLPLRASNMTSPKRARIIILCMMILFLLISTHFLFTTKVSRHKMAHLEEAYSTCEITTNGGKLAWSVIDGMMFSYIPIVIISIMNAVIVFELHNVNKHRAALIGNTSRSREHNKLSVPSDKKNSCKTSASKNAQNSSMVQLTVMLLVVSGTFILTTMPIAILKTIAIRQIISEENISASSAGQYQLVNAVAEILMFLNHAANFLLYCATGAKFRNQLRRLCISDQATSTYSARCSQMGGGMGMTGSSAREMSTVHTTSIHNVSQIRKPTIQFNHEQTERLLHNNDANEANHQLPEKSESSF